MEITLYFDAHTFSHVRTVYTLSLRASIVSTPGAIEQFPSPGAALSGPGNGRVETGETASSRQQTSRIRLEEEFDDFRNADGYAVPAKWKIKLTTETQQSRMWEWLVTISSVKNNSTVNAALLEVK